VKVTTTSSNSPVNIQ